MQRSESNEQEQNQTDIWKERLFNMKYSFTSKILNGWGNLINDNDTVFLYGQKLNIQNLYQKEQIIKKFVQHRIWMTYRNQIKPALINNYTNDTGWGCMIRVGQMIFAEGLRRYLNREIINVDQKQLIIIILQFLDQTLVDFEPKYSIHRISNLGKEYYNLDPGEWYSIDRILFILKKLHEEKPMKGSENLKIVIQMENNIYFDDILQQIQGNNDDQQVQLFQLCQNEKHFDFLKDLIDNSKNQLNEEFDFEKMINNYKQFFLDNNDNTLENNSDLATNLTQNKQNQSQDQQEEEEEEIKYENNNQNNYNQNIKQEQNQQQQQQFQEQKILKFIFDTPIICGKCISDKNFINDKKFILFIPCMISTEKINKIQFEIINQINHCPFSIGMMGGNKPYAQYYIGQINNDYIYLDPHKPQQSLNNQQIYDNLQSYFCNDVLKYSQTKVDPSLAFGFYFQNLIEFEIFHQYLQFLQLKYGNNFFLSLEKVKKYYDKTNEFAELFETSDMFSII